MLYEKQPSSQEDFLMEATAYFGLFLSAFVAATILPAQSEAVLIFLLLEKTHSVFLLLFVASLGNILGAVVNYGLGFWATSFSQRAWFPAKPKTLDRAKVWYSKYGRWSLLFSWVPFIGDPITVAAGVLREKLWIFLLLVTLAKTARYVALAAVTLSWI